MKSKLLTVVLLTMPLASGLGQEIQSLDVSQQRVHRVVLQDGSHMAIDFPLVSCEINGELITHFDAGPVTLVVEPVAGKPGHLRLRFQNLTQDTLRLSNVVPFGAHPDRMHITGRGQHRLSRTHLFIPGRSPVNVIVPDNAWELGYSCIPLRDSLYAYGLARRDVTSIEKGTRRRFETELYPGGGVSYLFYAESYTGEWQAGLRKAFQQRKLYDLAQFDESLYLRDDLKWIRKAYVMHLLMAWDKDFFDVATGTFKLVDFVKKGRNVYGGDDVVCIWPTWPSLGIDQRNQFDLYRDLPGGLPALRQLADTLRKLGTRFFIAYNPWDESTRREDHLKGLEELIRATQADGVVLDTKGESSRALQAAADAVRPGVVMYSEGMAVPKDMPGIVSGRVHNALYYPPMLNLNKLIKPEFAIFRVAEVYKEPIQREYAVSFFNGYGTEINQFAPGHPGWEADQYGYLGRTSRILREHSDVFTAGTLTPLVYTRSDSVWVNEWTSPTKRLFTVFSLKPGGFSGPLVKVKPRAGHHFVDLWHHENRLPIQEGTSWWLPIYTDAFHVARLGTNNEGEVTAVAEFPALLNCELSGNQLRISASRGDEIRVFAGNPDYSKQPVVSKNLTAVWDVRELFGRYEGKLVIQLFGKGELLDEVVKDIKPGVPRLVSDVQKEPGTIANRLGMKKIPPGRFTFRSTQGDEFIPYPKQNENKVFAMPAFWMDEFPVTNRQFRDFLRATGYIPADTTNFLKHWVRNEIPPGMENFPVVYVSYEDATAYARWAGKRLPTEVEWQYAAQTAQGNEWPWKQERPVTRKETYVTETLTVSALEGIDPRVANLGDGKLYPVGKYAKGANPFGLYDLSGCVWQLTNDVYESGSYRYVMMKGGSYFKPSSSWWYVQGGPRELHYRQILLRVSPGFERNGTVGFRCVAD